MKDKFPIGYHCPIGHYCPGGVPEPIPCQSNSQVNTTHAVKCNPCPAGHYCVIQGIAIVCEKGFYCPAGTGRDLKPCPKGTYGDQKGLYKVEQCKVCDAGRYCGMENATSSTGPCKAGHWCAYGVDRPDPIGENTTVAQPLNTSCPHYDGQETGFGGICPIGFYCPTASSAPLSCPPGTFGPFPKMPLCWPCMEGFYCPGNNSEYTSRPCPQGHYCPNGTVDPYQFPCDHGTYNDKTTKTNETDCLPCKPGMYCPHRGEILITFNTGTFLSFHRV